MQIIDTLNKRVGKCNADLTICGVTRQVKQYNNLYKKNGINKVICLTNDYSYKGVTNGDIGTYNGSVFKFGDVEIKSKAKIDGKRFDYAYAITVHKAQGMTITGNLQIDPSKLFEKNHLYVALTRATCLNNIYFTCPITPKMVKKTLTFV